MITMMCQMCRQGRCEDCGTLGFGCECCNEPRCTECEEELAGRDGMCDECRDLEENEDENDDN